MIVALGVGDGFIDQTKCRLRLEGVRSRCIGQSAQAVENRRLGNDAAANGLARGAFHQGFVVMQLNSVISDCPAVDAEKGKFLSLLVAFETPQFAPTWFTLGLQCTKL